MSGHVRFWLHKPHKPFFVFPKENNNLATWVMQLHIIIVVLMPKEPTKACTLVTITFLRYINVQNVALNDNLLVASTQNFKNLFKC